MNRAKVKKPPRHYLVVGSSVAGEGFPDRDGSTTLRLAKGTSLSGQEEAAIASHPHYRNTVTPSGAINCVTLQENAIIDADCRSPMLFPDRRVQAKRGR